MKAKDKDEPSKILLFLGFPLDSSFRLALEKVPKEKLHLLTHHGDYLEERVQGTQRFLGKTVGHLSQRPSLEQSQAHILSLLRKLVPDYPYESSSLVLFPVVEG